MLPTYVIITPARNEARFIEQTIQSVVGQTTLPLRWMIVSDGSTDGTDEIVERYCQKHSWIDLIRMPDRRDRTFAGKVTAFRAGHERVKALSYDVIASLDADISLDPEHFSFLLGKLAEDRELGLVGTPFKEAGTPVYDYNFVNIEHVSGACQVFRRECFEQVGGYVAIRGGGIDYVAVISARMKGWKTRSYPERLCFHAREMGTAQHGLLRARFKNGVKDYTLGAHPLWQVFRSVYQMTRPPRLIGGAALAVGYFWAMCRREARPVTPEFVTFRRDEEMLRLRQFIGRLRSRRLDASAISKKIA